MDYLHKRKRAGKKPEKRKSKTRSGEWAGIMRGGADTLSCYHFNVLKRQAHESAALLLQCVKVTDGGLEGSEGVL